METTNGQVVTRKSPQRSTTADIPTNTNDSQVTLGSDDPTSTSTPTRSIMSMTPTRCNPPSPTRFDLDLSRDTDTTRNHILSNALRIHPLLRRWTLAKWKEERLLRLETSSVIEEEESIIIPVVNLVNNDNEYEESNEQSQPSPSPPPPPVQLPLELPVPPPQSPPPLVVPVQQIPPLVLLQPIETVEVTQSLPTPISVKPLPVVVAVSLPTPIPQTVVPLPIPPPTPTVSSVTPVPTQSYTSIFNTIPIPTLKPPPIIVAENLPQVIKKPVPAPPTPTPVQIPTPATPPLSFPHQSQPKKFTEKIREEASIIQRMADLQREGLWYERRLPKSHEPSRIKAHWDYLLEEMLWLSNDFRQERKWKRKAAQKCSRGMQKYFQDKSQKLERAEKEEELKVKKLAGYIAKEVRNFWSNVQKLVEYQEQSKIEELKQKAMDQHLSFIVDQTEKFSSILAKSLNNPFLPDDKRPSTLADLNSEAIGALSDDEFEPSMDDEDDDEETISKAEGDARDVKAEIELLKKESEMSLEDVLVELPQEYIREKIAISSSQGEPSKDEKVPSKIADDDLYVPTDSDSDVEETIEAEEKLDEQNPQSYVEELKELDDDNKLSVEELMAKYSNHNEERIESEDDVFSDMSGVEEELTESGSAGDGPSVSETNEESEVTEDRATPDENEGGDDNAGLASLLENFAAETAGDKKAGEDDALNSVAALAQSFQPKGYTLSSTKVVTEVPSLLKYTLREYQHIGLDWLVTMYEKKLNGILADEMGLGKTIQTIALLAHLACVEGNWGPHLIVVPTSVMLNWEMEFKKWCPGFKILTYYGSQKERKQKRTGWTRPNMFHVCITSYKMVVQDHFSFRRRRWKYLILDEAQNIKNFKSQRWQLLLNFSTHRRLLLTGTPLQNNLMELWSLMHFLMPNVFQSHREFRDWFSNPVSGMVEGNTEYDQNIIRRLHKILRPFILRRLKCEVEKQLPQKYEHLVMCRLSKRQRHLYEDFMSRSRTRETLASGNLLSVMNVLMQLRKVCNHPNLFEARPINSPLQTEGLTHLIPSLVWNMMDNVALETVDSNLFRLTEADLIFGEWDVNEIKSLKPPRTIVKIREDGKMEQYFVRDANSKINEPYRPFQVVNSCRIKPVLERDIFFHDYSSPPPCPRLREPVPMFMMNVDPRTLNDEEFIRALDTRSPKRKAKPKSPKGRLISYNYDTKEEVRMPLSPTKQAPSISKLSTGQMTVVLASAGGHRMVLQGSRASTLMPPPPVPPLKKKSLVRDVSASPLAYSSAINNCTTIAKSNPGSPPTTAARNKDGLALAKFKDNVCNQKKVDSEGSVPVKPQTVSTSVPKQPSILAEVRKLNELDTTVSRKTLTAKSVIGEFEFSTEVSPFDDIQLEMEDDDTQTQNLKRRAESDTVDSESSPEKKSRQDKDKSDSEYDEDTVDEDEDDDDDDDEDDYVPKGLKQRTEAEKARFLARKNSKTNRTLDDERKRQSTDARVTADNVSQRKRRAETHPDHLSSKLWLRVHGYNPQDFELDEIEIRKLKDRKAVIERMQKTNDKRSEFHPVYGSDAIQACRIFEPPSITFPGEKRRRPFPREKDFKNQFYFHTGFAEIMSLIEQRKLSLTDAVINMKERFWRHTNCFQKLVWTTDNLMILMDEVLKRFVIFTPPVSAPIIDRRVFKPTSSRWVSEAKSEMEIKHYLKEPLKLLHPIVSSMATQFPDSRLIQYDCGKLQVLDNLLRRLKSETHRVLIFTQMTKMLDVLEIFLNYHGYIYLRLDGSTKIDQRQLLMEKFNTDKRIFCFILSTRSGGIGVNLTGADTVIFYDSDWNPTMDAQAQDRCHRIGQTRDVHIYRLVSEKTVEENILKKSNQKKLLGELAIEGGKFTTAYFQTHTIRDLFDVNVREMDVQKRMSEVLNARNPQIEPVAPEDSPPTTEVLSKETAAFVLESALTAAEDDTDVLAARTVQAENAAELAEFDENIPLDHLKEAAPRDGPSKIAQEMALIMQELNAVERFAIRFMENTIEDWSRDTYSSAQKEFEQQKKTWEMERMRRLEQEELDKHRKSCDSSDDDEMVTYSSEDAHNQVWFHEGSGEFMPIWAPPTPPQDESDVYIDRCHDYLYSRAVIPESLLPPPYIPPKKKPISAPSSPVKPVTPGTPPSANLVSSVTFTMEQGFETPTGISELSKKLPIKVHRREEPIFAPRSLFDRPSPALAKLRRDYRLQKYSGRAGSIPAVTKATLGPGSITFPVVSPVSNKPSVPPPTPVHPEKEWLYMEDYSVLQSMTSLLELPLSLMVVNLAQTPNWDMTSQIVNLGSRAHRSQKQCRQRYENVIGPREEGKLLFEPQIKKKKAKTFIKISPPSPQRAASLLKTSALLAQDNYAQFSKILMGRFDSIKAISAKRNPVSRPMTLNPHMKSNKQSLIFIEHGINFEVPVSATTIAQARYDRLVMERRKLLAAQEAARAHQIAMTAMPGIPLPAGPHAVIPIPAPGVPTVGTLPNTPSPGQSPNPVTCLSPILSLSPTNSASSASEAVAAQKARMAATVNASVSGTTSPLPSVPIPIAQTQSLATTPPPGNLLPLVLSPTTSSAITELIGRGVLTAGTTTTTSSPPKRQYTLQHHHSQLQHQLQLLQHHQLQQKQQQIQLAISQVPQTASNQLQQQQQQQLRQQQITSLSQAPIVTSTSSPSTSQSQTQPLVQLIQTTPTQQQQQQLQRGGPTKQVYITTPQTQPVQMPQQQQLQLQQQLLQQQRMQQQIQQHVLHAQHQHLHQQQQHQQQQPIQIQPSSQPKVTHSIVGNTLTSDYTVVTTLSGETFTTSITPQGISTISRMQPSLLQPIPRPMTSLSDLVSASAQKTPISVSSVGSSGIVGSQNVPGQFSLAPNPTSTLQPIVTRPTITQGPDRNSPMAKAARMSTKPVRQPTPAGTSISVPMVSTPATSQQQRERPAMQQLKRYQVISTGQSNVQGGMNILCASTNTSSPTSLTFLTTPMDPSNPSTSSQQRVSIVPTPVVGSVGSIVTPTSTRLQLVKQQTVGGKTVTRAISDAEMAALFKHGLSSQTRVVTTTGPVQGQITTSSSPIQLSASPLTPAAAQLMSLQESQRLQQQHPGGTSPAGATQLQQPRQLSSQMISIGGMTPSKVNAPTQGPTTLIYTPSSTKAPGTIVPTSTPPTVTKFTPAQLQSIKQNYIRQHNQIVMSSASSSQPTEQTAPGLHQQQLKRIQVFTNPSQPPIVVSTAPTTTTTSNLPISLGSVIITSAASSNTFPSSGMSQPITQVTSTMTAGISPQQRMTTVYQPGSLMTTMSSSTSLPVVNPINQRSHIQLVKQSIGGKVITRQISELEMNEILKQHCSNPQNAGQTLSIHTRPIQQGGTRELPTLPSVIEFSQVPGLQPLRLQPTTSGAGPIPITLPGISGELGSNVAPVSLPGSLSGFTQIQTTPAVTTSTPTISTPDEVGPAIIPVANPNPSRTQDLANTISPEPVSSTVNLLQIHPNVSNSQSQSQQPP